MFFFDMGPTYKVGLQLDRIDNNGNYGPDNCRWVDRKTNCRNRSNGHMITFNGETKTLAEWEELTGIHRKTIEKRIANGWQLKNALSVVPACANRWKNLGQS